MLYHDVNILPLHNIFVHIQIERKDKKRKHTDSQKTKTKKEARGWKSIFILIIFIDRMTKISLTTIAWRLSPGTLWSAQSRPKPGFHVFMLWWHCDCPGNTARMVTAGFSRLKPRTVTCEDELGPKLSPGKFTLTPSWLVPFPDLSLQMAEERGMGSGSINVISHVISHRESWKWLNVSPTPRTVKWKSKKALAHIGELHDKSMNRCRILHTKQMTASPCKASRMKLLANEREQVQIRMSALRKTRTKKKSR